MQARRSRRLALVLLAAGALVVGSAGPAQGDQVVRLSHDAVRNLDLATLTGAVAPSRPLGVATHQFWLLVGVIITANRSQKE